jgi:succinoglycan biosynthesis transport protein ExoP
MQDITFTSMDVRAAVGRRLPTSATAALFLIAITVALALGLPSYFKSRAVILIEAQEMPQDLVRSLVTSFTDQRIQIITQRVLTNSNLTQIIEKYDLYGDQRRSKPLEVVLENMRKDISIAPISADVTDPKAGRTTQTTIAFELAYESRSPELAQRVANEVVSLFLSENLRQRNETTRETLTFLTSESEKLREQVGDLEQKLATFKEENVEQLPELNNLNIEMMNRTDNDIRSLDTQIRSLEQQKVYLESELAQQKPNVAMFSQTGERILGAADRLKVLESELIPLSGRYGPNHPDVVAKRKEIESLRASVSDDGSSDEMALKLKQARAELRQLTKKYSADHPDVKSLKREVAGLEAQLANQSGVLAEKRAAEVPDNPAYVELRARLDGTESDLRGLRSQQGALRAKISSLEARIARSPEVERKYRGLTRDLESAQLKYQEIMAKRQEAEVSTNLESERKGERFTLIEPPVTPEEPSKPNRIAIGLLGGLLSIATGVGLGVLLENFDGRIYGRSGVLRVLGVPPLAIIPGIQTEHSQTTIRRTRLAYIAVGLAILIVAGVLVHFFFRPLDVVFYQILRIINS